MNPFFPKKILNSMKSKDMTFVKDFLEILRVRN